MKVKFTDTMKNIVTVAEMPAVKAVMQYEKEDDYSAQDWAKVAANMLFDHSNTTVLKADAAIAKNQRVWNVYGEGTGDIDVWIMFTAFNGTEYFGGDEFVAGGVYLSDLWNLTSSNAEEIKQHMYIRRFKEVKG